MAIRLIIFVGLSLKGKNRIKEHGNAWEIIKETHNQLLVKSTDSKEYLRWVDKIGDKDFEIKK